MHSDDPVLKLLQIVATAEDDNVRDLPPLYETVDPDALAMLFAHDSDNDPRVRVEFTYLSYRIIIDDAGEVTVLPADGR